MDTKHIILGAGAALSVAALAHFAWQRWGGSIPGDVGVGVAAANQPTSDATTAYTPTMQSYAPLPVGVSTNATASAPPGVPDTQVSTGASDPGNAAVTVEHEDHVAAAMAASNPAQGSIASYTGLASIPDGAASSAPALTGNAQIIDNEYVKLFGRHAEQAGLDYWGNVMAHNGLTASGLDTALIGGAQGSDISAAVVRNPAQYINAFTPRAN